MVARKELETIMKRYRDSDNNQKMSTPSGFGVFINVLDKNLRKSTLYVL